MKDTQLVVTSPFDTIRQCSEDQEYWSARDLQTLLGYTEWRNFERTIKKAMTASRNVGQNERDHFVDTNKIVEAGVTSKPVKDYRLTRFACYLTAMNGDPDKQEIAQAQTYFAVKTREAEIQSAQLAPTYTISHALRQRVLVNEDSVPDDLFAVLVECGKELYYWERIVNEFLDDGGHIEISLGSCWANYLKQSHRSALEARRRYRHRLPNGQEVLAWGYPIKYLPTFRRWLRDTYFPKKFSAYARYRAKLIGAQTEQKLIGAKDMRAQLQLVRRGVTQLSLFC